MNCRAVLFAFALLASSEQAFAQQVDTVTASTRTMFQLGYCAVQHDSAGARKLFTMPPGSQAEAKLLRSLTSAQCFGFLAGSQNPEFDRQLMRGVIAEAILDESRKHGERLDRSVAPFGELSADVIGALDAKGQATLRGLDFAQCVDAASPNGVRALLKTDPGLSGQDKAFEQLGPYLGPCLQKGAQVNLSKLVLRGLLAEAAYRSFYFTAVAGKK